MHMHTQASPSVYSLYPMSCHLLLHLFPTSIHPVLLKASTPFGPVKNLNLSCVCSGLVSLTYSPCEREALQASVLFAYYKGEPAVAAHAWDEVVCCGTTRLYQATCTVFVSICCAAGGSMQGLLHNTGPTAHVRAASIWVGRQTAFSNVQGQSVYGL